MAILNSKEMEVRRHLLDDLEQASSRFAQSTVSLHAKRALLEELRADAFDHAVEVREIYTLAIAKLDAQIAEFQQLTEQ